MDIGQDHRLSTSLSSVVPIIRLPGTPPSLSHNTPRSNFIEERQAKRYIVPVIRSCGRWRICTARDRSCDCY